VVAHVFISLSVVIVTLPDPCGSAATDSTLPTLNYTATADRLAESLETTADGWDEAGVAKGLDGSLEAT